MFNNDEQSGGRTNLPAVQQERREVSSFRRAPETSPLWEEDSGLDWRQIAYALWRKKWWIAAATALGVAAGVYLADSIEPVYETRATVWVESTDGDRGPIQGEEVFEGQGWADLFQSRVVVEPVVREFQLYLRPEGRAKRSDLFGDFELQGDAVPGTYTLARGSGGSLHLKLAADSTIQTVASGEPVGEPVGFRWNPPAERIPDAGDEIRFRLTSVPEAGMHLRSNLTVNFSPKAGNLITTRLEGNEPDQVAAIHNAIVESFMEQAYNLKSQKQREVVDILENQSEYAADRLEEAELSLESYRVQTVTLPQDRQQAAPAAGLQMTRDPVFDAFFQKKLEASQMRSEIDQLENLLQRARSGNLSSSALQVVPAVAQAPPLQDAVSQVINKRAQRRVLLQSYTEQHPDVQEITEEIRALENQLIPARLSDLLQQKRSQLASLEGEIDSQASNLREIPTRSIEEARRERDMQMAEDLHKNLLVRLKEAELAASTSLPDLQVVDRAYPPSSPTSNDGMRLFLLASMAGLGLGLGGVVILDRFDGRLRYPDQVSADLGLPILGVVPDLRELKPGRVADDAQVIESFRSIRTQLDRIAPRNGTVLVTSPAPKEGKSLISANLAIAYASTGRRTLLLDADTRRGNVHETLACEPEPGLTECLLNKARFEEAIQRTSEVQNLSVLSHGSRRGFRVEMLDSSAMAGLMARARSAFDVIVVDTPPLVAGSDALVLSEYAEKVLLVIRAGATEGELAEAQLEAVDRFGLPVVGAVLNDVSEHAPYYKYYSRYEYYGDVEVLPSAS